MGSLTRIAPGRALLAVLMLAGALVAPAVSGADTAVKVGNGERFWGSSVVFDGTSAYVIGTCDLPWIWRFDPSTRTTTKLPAVLPRTRCLGASVWTGSKAYLFGGNDIPGGANLNRIIEFDPVAGTVTIMPTALPVAGGLNGWIESSAVWDGTYAWVFGGAGYDGSGLLKARNSILKYDPLAGTVTTMSATLQEAMWGSGAAFDGRYAYTFGGQKTSGWSGEHIYYSNLIQKYDTQTDTLTLAAHRLPVQVARASVVQNGRDVFIIGGHGSYAASGSYGTTSGSPAITAFHMRTGIPNPEWIQYMSATMSPGRGAGAAFFDGQSAWVLGGWYDEQVCDGYGGCSTYRYILDDQWRIDFKPGAPTSPLAVPATPVGSIKLTWTAPSYATVPPGSPVTSYKIYRATLTETEHVVATVAGNYASYYDYSCKLGNLCLYRVSAVNAYGESPKSGQAIAAGWYV